MPYPSLSSFPPSFLPTHTSCRQIIAHYAHHAAAPPSQHPRSLFLASLGPLIEQSNRRFDAFYRQPPANPHPGKLGYEALGDMLAWHVKVGVIGGGLSWIAE